MKQKAERFPRENARPFLFTACGLWLTMAVGAANMDERTIHLAVTYGFMAVEGTITGLIFWQTFSRPIPVKSRIGAVFVGIYMLFLTIGCLAGVGTHKHDDYWKYHQAPWPGASVFYGIDAIVFIVTTPVLWVVNAIKKWKEPPTPD